MGLKKSEHISKIIIHPKNSEILWVISQGPLWNKGGRKRSLQIYRWWRILDSNTWR